MEWFQASPLQTKWLGSDPSSGSDPHGWDRMPIDKPITGQGGGTHSPAPWVPGMKPAHWEHGGQRVGERGFPKANQEMLPKKGKQMQELQMSTSLSCFVPGLDHCAPPPYLPYSCITCTSI